MELDEVADVAARDQSPAHGYAGAAGQWIVGWPKHKLLPPPQSAMPPPHSAMLQTVQKMTLWAVFLLIPAALLSIVIGWLLAKILGVA